MINHSLPNLRYMTCYGLPLLLHQASLLSWERPFVVQGFGNYWELEEGALQSCVQLPPRAVARLWIYALERNRCPSHLVRTVRSCTIFCRSCWKLSVNQCQKSRKQAFLDKCHSADVAENGPGLQADRRISRKK